MGDITGGIRSPHERGGSQDVGHPCDAPMLVFDNLVKKLDNHCKPTSNIDIYPSTLEICVNNLLKLLFFGSGPPHPHPQTLPETTPPHQNHTSAQYFQRKITYLLTVNV